MCYVTIVIFSTKQLLYAQRIQSVEIEERNLAQ